MSGNKHKLNNIKNEHAVSLYKGRKEQKSSFYQGKGKDIINLIELPLVCFQRNIIPISQESGVLSIVSTNRITKHPVHGYIKVIVKDNKNRIVASSLSSSEEDLMVGLIEMTYRQGFNGRRVEFSTLSQILEYAGWSKGGKSIKKVVQSLIALKSLEIETDLFWDSEQKVFQWKRFNLIDEISFDHIDNHGLPLPMKKQKGHFLWNEIVYNEIDRGFIKSLDTDLYKKIKIAAARKLYRILDRRFYKKQTVWIPLEYLCVNILRLENYGLWYFKRQIKKYSDELIRVGYIKESWIGNQSGQDHVYFEKEGAQKDMFPAIENVDIENPEVETLLEAMLSLGVGKAAASSILSSRGTDYIAKWIDCVLRGKALKSGTIENQAAFLVAALQQEFVLPSHYLKYLEDKEDTDRREIEAQKRKKAIENCQMCDSEGYAYIKYNTSETTKKVVMAKCNHKQIQFYGQSAVIVSRQEFLDFSAG